MYKRLEEWTSKMRTEEAGAAMQGTLRAAWAMYSERSMSPRVSDNVGGPLPSEQCLQLYQAELKIINWLRILHKRHV